MMKVIKTSKILQNIQIKNNDENTEYEVCETVKVEYDLRGTGEVNKEVDSTDRVMQTNKQVCPK